MNARPQMLAFGGGVDSTAILAMALWPHSCAEILAISVAEIRAAVPRYDAVVFADPGAEFPATYENVETAQTMCEIFGMRFEITRHATDNIRDMCLRLGVVPVLPGASHACSRKFKGDVLERWTRENMDEKPVVSIGIEANEGHRCKRFTPPKGSEGDFRYPLRDLQLTRADCERLIDAVWPHAVRKSSCVFCPFMSEEEIHDLVQNHPEAWELACQVEEGFRQASREKHQRWLDAGQPRTGKDGKGRAPVGMWSRDSWAEGGRLFAKSIDGQRLSTAQWAERAASK